MDEILRIAKKYNLFVVEDAAQAVDSYYKGRPLGSIGQLAAFSFHETKNIISGEGGMLVLNDERFIKRAEIIWEKGTNRAEFFRGDVSKYGWVDIGSSFLPSEVISAFLFAQLENLDDIQAKRKKIWSFYYTKLKFLEEQGKILLPLIPDYATNNAHMFYFVCRNFQERTELLELLKQNDILAVFHYLSLHKSTFYENKHDGRILVNSDRYDECLIRLPLFYELTEVDINKIIKCIIEFYKIIKK
jgi:dTDP-4-amino-4,6-dideoxygalactose transaminase